MRRVPEFKLSKEQRDPVRGRVVLFVVVVVATHVLGITAICLRIYVVPFVLDRGMQFVVGIVVVGCASGHLLLNVGMMLVPIDVAAKKRDWYDPILRWYMNRDLPGP
jgi:hypothetical protein